MATTTSTDSAARRWAFETKIKSLLEKREMTQRQLAAQTGVTPRQINRIVRGQCTPKPPLARAIARELRVRLDKEALFGSGEFAFVTSQTRRRRPTRSAEANTGEVL